MVFNNFRLFLDDKRHPKKSYETYLTKIKDNLFSSDESYLLREWHIVKTYNEFVDFIITYGVPKYISFDNDLGEKMEGKDCVKWLIDYMMDNDADFTPIVEFHTANPVAKKDMEFLVKNYKKYRNNLHKNDEKFENFLNLCKHDPQTAINVFDSLTAMERMRYLLKIRNYLKACKTRGYNQHIKNTKSVLFDIVKSHLGVYTPKEVHQIALELLDNSIEVLHTWMKHHLFSHHTKEVLPYRDTILLWEKYATKEMILDGVKNTPYGGYYIKEV